MGNDLISRSALEQSFDEGCVGECGCCEHHHERHVAFGKWEEWCDLIKKAPTIDAVEVVHGHWIRCDGKSIVWYCSECGGKILYNPNPRTYNINKPKVEQYNKFCRNCGAKMDGGAE